MIKRRSLLAGAIAGAATKTHAFPRGGLTSGGSPSGLAAQIAVPSGAFAGTYNYAMAGGTGQTVIPQQSYTDWGRGGASQFTQASTLITNSGLANFRVYFRVDTSGTQNVSECILEYGDGSATAGAVDLAAGYTVTVTNNGVTVYTGSVVGQGWCTRWRVTSQNGGTWGIANTRPVTRTLAQLIAGFYLPAYSSAGLSGAGTGIPANVTYTPLGNSGLLQPMNTGGDRPEIGPFTNWQGYYFCTGLGLTNIFQIAEAACSWNLVYRDTRASGGSFIGTLAPIDCSPTGAFARASLIAGASPGGTLVQTSFKYPYTTGSNMIYDSGHSPNFSYLAFMMTGDPYYLENMQFQMNRDLLASGQGFRYSTGGRYLAWPVRNTMMARIATPASTPNWMLTQAQVAAILTQYDNFIANQTGAGAGNLWTGLGLYSNNTDPATSGTAMWQNDYLGIVANLGQFWSNNGVLAAGTGIQQLAIGLTASAVARTNGTSGWNRSLPSIYDSPTGPLCSIDPSVPLNVGDTTITFASTCSYAFTNGVSGGFYPTTVAPTAIFTQTPPYNVSIGGNIYTISGPPTGFVYPLSAPSAHAAGVNSLIWGPNVANWPDFWTFQSTAGAPGDFAPLDNTTVVNTGTGVASFHTYFHICRCAMAMAFTAGTTGAVSPAGFLNPQLSYANAPAPAAYSDWKWMIAPTT